MQKKQVAIIDVGSSQITAVIGERGVNKTFVIKNRFSSEYDGYADGEFFDRDKLNKILFDISEKIISSTRGKINTVYVGVPGEFTSVTVKDSQLSFDNGAQGVIYFKWGINEDLDNKKIN